MIERMLWRLRIAISTRDYRWLYTSIYRTVIKFGDLASGETKLSDGRVEEIVDDKKQSSDEQGER